MTSPSSLPSSASSLSAYACGISLRQLHQLDIDLITATRTEDASSSPSDPNSPSQVYVHEALLKELHDYVQRPYSLAATATATGDSDATRLRSMRQCIIFASDSTKYEPGGILPLATNLNLLDD